MTTPTKTQVIKAMAAHGIQGEVTAATLKLCYTMYVLATTH